MPSWNEDPEAGEKLDAGAGIVHGLIVVLGFWAFLGLAWMIFA